MFHGVPIISEPNEFASDDNPSLRIISQIASPDLGILLRLVTVVRMIRETSKGSRAGSDEAILILLSAAIAKLHRIANAFTFASPESGLTTVNNKAVYPDRRHTSHHQIEAYKGMGLSYPF
jgi:hypothetical protein